MSTLNKVVDTHKSINPGIKERLYCLFIGQSLIDLEQDNIFFKVRSFASDFESASKFISSIHENKTEYPDAILIDKPLSTKNLEDFLETIKKIPRLKNIPLVYGSSFLSNDSIAILKSKDLVDDVFDLNKFGIDLYRKISFLKKVKNHPPAPFLRRLDYLESASNFMSSGYFAKRIFDVLVSLSIIVLSLPIFVLIAIAIKLDSKGPIFYTSLRAGRKYKVFSFYKFRSMVFDAESLHTNVEHLNQYKAGNSKLGFLKINNDPRVTKVGKFLRKTSLDELPQMFNVLKGDMSLVGNRPLPLREAETLTTNDYIERFMAPAGITGLWQVTKKGKPNMTSEERIDLDIIYAQRSNLINDFKIIFKTPAALIQDTNN